MRAHHATLRALSDERLTERARAAERERAAARAVAEVRERERAAAAFGDSLRLRDGRWVHLRHDSA